MPQVPLLPLPIECWAGIECTLNRVGDRYFDQLAQSGHLERSDDLELFAGLGLRTLRYPVLWEQIAPDGLEQADWALPDDRLARLLRLGIAPIAGLIHHGSGPRYTSLIDRAFPEQLAVFAGAVAERYPWIAHYTPVNEPLTTARFSGLYGHWYPHGRDEATFVRALVHQCRAVVLAMRAVRRFNPSAQLVQTEDLGKVFSVPKLAYQADFENERRWLSLDLLTGRVDSSHPLWMFLLRCGIEERELAWHLDNPCPPDLIGINHYLTSERFLDDRLQHYPRSLIGGNHCHTYADVEAVRVLASGLAGPEVLLAEVWERYKLPIAVTEVHLGCTREEQLRWLAEVWNAAENLQQRGVDIRAVTVWSLLGAYDWNSLVTRAEGHYEPGVFDLRAPAPRPTALAKMIATLSRQQKFDHPVLATPGWWRRPERLLYPPFGAACETAESGHTPVLLVAGANGRLGRAFARIAHERGLACRGLSRSELDIANPDSVQAALDRWQPWAIVNAAEYGRVDEAEGEPEVCRRANTLGPALLAAECARRGIALVTFSSDLVFDGLAQRPYIESDGVSPLGCYGLSKAEAEALVLKALPTALVVRTGALFSPWDPFNFVTAALQLLADGKTLFAADAVASPTYIPHLVHASLDLLIDGEEGLWHLANPSALSWANAVRLAAQLAGLDPRRIRPSSAARLHRAPRPQYSALGSERGTLLPPLEKALAQHLREGGGAIRAALRF